MPVPLLPPLQPELMPEPQQTESDSQQGDPAQGSGKKQQGQPGKGEAQGGAGAAKDSKGVAEGQAAQGAPPRAGKPGGKADEHDDNTAAALLLGMGSKSDSEGGGSAGSSGRNKANGSGHSAIAGVAAAARRRQHERGAATAASGAATNGAAAECGQEDEGEEEEESEEEERGGGNARGKGRRGGGGGVRRSTRRGRTPAYRASELLGSGSDDEFDPGSKRAPKATTGTARAPSTVVPQKSELTLLCERFQQQFGHLQADGTPNMLMLNDVAEALGVPRRRLYDVINVFESIEVMRRVGKLMYEWVGFDHLPALLEQLAQDEANGVPVEDRIRRAPTLIIVNEQGEEIGSGKGNSHSLWVLSRRLVRMLLKQRGPIALTAAAAVLVGPGGVSDPSKHRSQTQITVERRLYDIGSILCSVGLLERIYMKKRQPAFEWIYGWRPGDTHDPPKLPNRVAQPEDEAATQVAAAGRAGRKRAAKAAAAAAAAAAANDAKKFKSAAELSAEAAMLAGAGGMPMGALPFGMPMAGFGPMMMPPGMMAGGQGASPAMFMGGMAGMPTMGDDKQAAAAMASSMQMAPFFAPPGAFFANPMMQMNGMPMAMPAAAAAAAEPSPPSAEAAGPQASGDSAAAAGGANDGSGAGSAEDPAAAAAAAAAGSGMAGMGGGPPGMMMWHPQMAMMNPAMMQQFQMQQAALMKTSEQMQQAAVAGSSGGKAGMPATAPSPFPGVMMAPAGMMMAPYPIMQPMQNFVPVAAGAAGSTAP